MKKSGALLLMFALLLVFQGCKKKTEEIIEIPEILKSPAQEDWAVIQEPYASFFDEPVSTSGIAAHARRGDVLKIEGRKIDDNRQLWLKFDHGWVQESVVVIYSNKLKAQKAALLLEN